MDVMSITLFIQMVLQIRTILKYLEGTEIYICNYASGLLTPVRSWSPLFGISSHEMDSLVTCMILRNLLLITSDSLKHSVLNSMHKLKRNTL